MTWAPIPRCLIPGVGRDVAFLTSSQVRCGEILSYRLPVGVFNSGNVIRMLFC